MNDRNLHFTFDTDFNNKPDSVGVFKGALRLTDLFSKKEEEKLKKLFNPEILHDKEVRELIKEHFFPKNEEF